VLEFANDFLERPLENSLKRLFADSSDHEAKIDLPQSTFNAIDDDCALMGPRVVRAFISTFAATFGYSI
jgi:hypothetical protein